MLFPIIAATVERLKRWRMRRRLMSELQDEYKELLICAKLGDLGDGFLAAKNALEEVYVDRGLSEEEVRYAMSRAKCDNIEA